MMADYVSNHSIISGRKESKSALDAQSIQSTAESFKRRTNSYTRNPL